MVRTYTLPRRRERVLTRCIRAELNAECTKFVNEHGRTLDKEQFDAEYPFEI